MLNRDAMENSITSIYNASLERCLQHPSFIESFYQEFLDASPEIRARFAATHFQRQSLLLTKSLRLIGGASEGTRESLRELTERAETHSKQRLDIRPELYEFWKTALLETAAATDSDWNDESASAWSIVLDQAIHHMVSRYE